LKPIDKNDLSQWLGQARLLASTHRRSLSAGVLILTTGFAVTAFGIAPMMPDAALLPKHLLAEPVSADPIAPQLEALAGMRMQLARNDTTRSSDTADSLLRRLGVADADAANFLRTDATAQRLLLGRAGKMVSATLTADGSLARLVARYPADSDANSTGPGQFTRLTVERGASGAWQVHTETADLTASVRLASGTIRSSLFAATDDADVPDAVAVQMADMFSSDIDFRRELRKGDTFSVVYQALTADGEPINWSQGIGRVLAAEFVNDGQSHSAVWYDQGKAGYYDLQGVSKRRAFLGSPLAFSRITSGFAMRFHPILQKWRWHKGIDYGAPSGTPVHCVGDGVVTFAGWQNGYGNVVQVSHSADRMTVYAHLSKIEMRRGQHVSQGEEIGLVGATGWATGPHLHFEFREHGVQEDPLKVAKASESVALDPNQRQRFLAGLSQVKVELQAATELNGRAGRIE
jgi:murein DD-endopeptidase MepM/ murein hydrolase activator NlpD